jgi:Asp/Glu/hydantoin racemase
MKIVVLNPNTTQAMTDAVVMELKIRLPKACVTEGLTSHQGSAIIDSRDSFAIGARSALAMLPEVALDADAILLACFGDPGLDSLQKASVIPVIGLAQAAMRIAINKSQPFAMITAGINWIEMLRECATRNEADRWLTNIYALDVNGGQLLSNPEAFKTQVADLSIRAADEGAVMLIFGGAAFASLHFSIDPRLTVINAMDCAVQLLMDAVKATHTESRLTSHWK